MPDGFEVAVRWAVALTEPLLSTRARVAADDAMRDRAAADPEWAATLFGGVLADVLTTLPPDDPWRHLSARMGDISIGTPPAAEPGTGAWLRNPEGRWQRFGTWRDAADLTGRSRTPPTCGRTRRSQRWPNPSNRPPPRCWRSPPAAAPSPATRWPRWARTGRWCSTAGADALRWAVHRRRAYRGPGDLWPVEALTEWAAAAENDNPAVRPVPDRELIPAGSYRELIGD